MWYGFNQIICEPIRLTEMDFRYRHQSCPSIDHILKYWKQLGYASMPTTRPPMIHKAQTDKEKRKEQEASEQKKSQAGRFGAQAGYGGYWQ
jgi:hypothetical protein